MNKRAVACRACVCFACLLTWAASASASSNWSSIKTGPFIVYSQYSPKTTREAAAVLEQFRFSMGELLGRRDLAISPPLQFFLSNDPGTHVPAVTRTGALGVVQQGSVVTPESLRSIGGVLLKQNVGRMPREFDEGLTEFLSTTQVKGAHVTWGVPPADPSSSWALIDYLVTNPDTYGKVRVLLANVERDIDASVAYRNALGKSRAEIDKEVAAFRNSGAHPIIDAPSRPINPDRDFVLRQVEPTDIELALADLLNGGSEDRYRSLLNQNKFRVECDEGLALMAARRKDSAAAADLLKQAVDGGSKNAFAMLEYARGESDPDKSTAMLRKAIEANPNLAEPHFFLAQRLADPNQRIEQLSIATKLAPREESYWLAYAEALAAIRQWGPAAKAYRGAEQAAATSEEREKALEARLAIEGQRLDYEDAEKRREEQARIDEINRLKREAVAEIRAAEAKANGGVSESDAVKGAVDWSELHAPNAKAEGQLTAVECDGSQFLLTIKVISGKSTKAIKLKADQSTLSITGPGHPALACGDSPERRVSIAYIAGRDAHAGSSGEAVSLEFR